MFPFDAREFYGERADWRNKGEEKKRFKRVVGLVDVPVGATVLDLGCRDGKLRNYLSPDISYQGVDIVEDWGFGRPDILTRDLNERLPFHRRCFDYIFCIDLLEHLKKPAFSLSEMRRVLKDEGLVVVSIPNPYHFKEILWNIFDVSDKQGHMFSWTPQTFKRLCDSCGFKVVETSGTYLIPAIGCSGLLARSIIYKLKKK